MKHELAPSATRALGAAVAGGSAGTVRNAVPTLRFDGLGRALSGVRATRGRRRMGALRFVRVQAFAKLRSRLRS